MSAMQPQGASPIPPALLAVLAAHQGGAQPQAPQPAPQEQDESERGPIEILKQMIQLGNQFIQEEPDAADKATMAKLLATLHQYLAQEQKDAESALGGGSATRLLRRAG